VISSFASNLRQQSHDTCNSLSYIKGNSIFRNTSANVYSYVNVNVNTGNCVQCYLIHFLNMLLEIDFLILWIKFHLIFLIALAESVDLPEYSSSSNCIRGYNHPCGYVCSPLKE
jgi:hypothetical protein